MSESGLSSSPTGASDHGAAAFAQAAGTSPPSVANIKLMSYAERRMSAGLLYDTGRRRTSSFGTYSRVVLVAVDQSEHSKNAFDWYLANVWRLEDLVVLVHCPEAPKLPTLSFRSGIQPPLDEWKKSWTT
jgi:hypothetical protein